MAITRAKRQFVRFVRARGGLIRPAGTGTAPANILEATVVAVPNYVVTPPHSSAADSGATVPDPTQGTQFSPYTPPS